MTMSGKISVTQFCEIYDTDRDFLLAFYEWELIELTEEQGETYIAEEALPFAERLVRLHQDLGINREGLHTIHHLLERMKLMQEEIRSLENRLRFYEE